MILSHRVVEIYAIFHLSIMPVQQIWYCEWICTPYSRTGAAPGVQSFLVRYSSVSHASLVTKHMNSVTHREITCRAALHDQENGGTRIRIVRKVPWTLVVGAQRQTIVRQITQVMQLVRKALTNASIVKVEPHTRYGFV